MYKYFVKFRSTEKVVKMKPFFIENEILNI